MSKQSKTFLTILISILLAAGLIWWTTRDIDFGQTIASLRQADYTYVGISTLLGILAYFLRSERWRILLSPLGHEPKSHITFAAVCLNYFWNLIIPRSGEVARCTSLYTMSRVPVDKSFGTVITERIIDFICLGMVAALTLVLKFDLIKDLFTEVMNLREANNNEPKSYTMHIILAIVGLLIFALFFAFKNKLKHTRIYRQGRIFVYGLRKGIKTVFLLKQKRAFLLYTLAIWFCYYLMTYIMVFSLPETQHLGWDTGLFLLLVGGIGMVIPASGGIGAYHAAMKVGFIVLGLGDEIGVTYGFLVHTPHTLIAVVLGLISFGIMFKNKTENRKTSFSK